MAPGAAEPPDSLSAREASEQVLRFFWDLASLERNKRESAADGLLQEMQTAQSALSSGLHAKTMHGKADAPDDCAPLLVYALERLMRGLGSGRQGARQGFALALTVLLREIPAIPTPWTLASLTTHLKVSSSMKGSEAKDMLLGHIFGLAAAVHAGRVQDMAAKKQVASQLLTLGGKKAFVQELAVSIFLQIADGLSSVELEQLLQLPEAQHLLHLKQEPNPVENHEKPSPQALWAAFMLWGRMPEALAAKCPLLPGLCRDPTLAPAGSAAADFFQPHYLQAILPALQATSASHPRLHSLWEPLLSLLLPGFQVAKGKGSKPGLSGKGAGQIEAFWQTVVEAGLLSSSHERKYLGMQLFRRMLPALRAEQMPVVLSSTFLRVLANALTRRESYLHPIAHPTLQLLESLAGAASDKGPATQDGATSAVRVAVAIALQKPAGRDLALPGQPGAKMARRVLQGLDAQGVSDYLDHLKSVFLQAEAGAAPAATQALPDGTAPAAVDAPPADLGAERAQSWTIEQMAGALQLPAASSATWQSALHFLALQAFFVMGPKASKSKAQEVKQAAAIKTPPSRAVQLICASRLVTLISAARPSTQSAHRPKGGPQKKKGGGPAEAGGEPGTEAGIDALAEVTSFLRTASKEKHVTRTEGSQAAAEDLLPGLQGLEDHLTSLSNSDASQEPLRKGMLLLTRLLQLQVLSDPEAIGADLVVDLQMATDRAFGAGTAAAEDGDAWQDVLLGTLLTLLAAPSQTLPTAPLRAAVQAVFRPICPQLTASGVQELMKVVTQSGLSAGQPAEGGAEEESGTGSEEEEDDEEEEADSADDSESENSEAEAPNAATEKAQGADASDEEEEMEDMDDEAMFRMDEHMAAVLRARKDAQPSTSRRAVTEFRFRALALLDDYVKRCPTSHHLPSLLAPLLKAVAAAAAPAAASNGKQEGTKAGNPALAARLQGVLAQISRKADAIPAASMTKVELEAMLESTLKLACKQHSKAVAAGAAAALQTLLALALSGDQLEMAETFSSRLIHEWLQKGRCSVGRPSIEQLCQRCSQLGPCLLSAATSAYPETRTGYLRHQGLALLASLLKASQAWPQHVRNHPQWQDAGNKVGGVLLAALRGPSGFKDSQQQVEALLRVASCLSCLAPCSSLSYPAVPVLHIGVLDDLKATLTAAQQSRPAAKVAAALTKVGSVLSGEAAQAEQLKKAKYSRKRKHPGDMAKEGIRTIHCNAKQPQTLQTRYMYQSSLRWEDAALWHPVTAAAVFCHRNCDQFEEQLQNENGL
ncbi:hypothetical protein WJX74_002012 [Apatococcus lobatus]|uniref:DNA polymerase V n=1 Tax=Apatococcus lobatus TaxID=904363 RepID=A0AAW1R291_9CHLO